MQCTLIDTELRFERPERCICVLPVAFLGPVAQLIYYIQIEKKDSSVSSFFVAVYNDETINQ